MKEKNQVIIRIDKETGKSEQVSMSYALSKLDGYWIKKDIKPMLLKGDILWTPFAEYKLKQDSQ